MSNPSGLDVGNQMKTTRRPFDSRQLTLTRGFRAQPEPALRGKLLGLTAAQIRRLAQIYFRWAKQMFLLADLMDRDASLPVPSPRAQAPAIPDLRGAPFPHERSPGPWRN